MTDQEKADIELSLAMIDQTVATQDLTKSTKELRDASDMEVDASLDLTDSKEKVIDQMGDLEYSLSEQNRAEKRYLNMLSNRLDIEKKIGLTDYSQIDKMLHQKLAEELEKRLKEEEERRKQSEENSEEEEETETKQRKTDSEYLREAEKFHQKQKGMFQRISDSHKNYMQTSNSFFGRLAMGALGKGTSELLGAIDNVTDMIPGAKQVKQVGGFVRDQWKGSREMKRQDMIQNTAKMLRLKDETPIADNADEQKDEDNKRKTTEGVTGTFVTLTKILDFLKKLGQSLMFMGIFKSMMGLVGSAVTGMAGLISSGVMTALTSLGIVGLLKGITSAVTSGLSGLARAMGLKLPTSPDAPDVDKDKTKKTPKTEPKKTPSPKGPKKPGMFSRVWNATKGLFGAGAVKAAVSRGTLATIGRVGATAAGVASAPVTAGMLAMTPGVAGEGSDRVDDFADPNVRAQVAERNKKSMLEGYAKEYKDMYGDKPLLNEKGNVDYYPNPNNDRDIAAENERRFKMDVNTGLIENTEKEFRELTNAATELEKVKEENRKQQSNGMISSAIQQSTVNNINNTTNKVTPFGFSPYQYQSNKYSRGETD